MNTNKTKELIRGGPPMCQPVTIESQAVEIGGGYF